MDHLGIVGLIHVRDVATDLVDDDPVDSGSLSNQREKDEDDPHGDG